MTLIELLVVAATMVVVVSATLTFLEVATRAQTRDQAWEYALQNAQTGLARMVGEIRQATNVNAGDGSFIDFNVTENSQSLHVAYYCNVPQAGTSYSECVRIQAALGGALPAVSAGTQILVRVKNPTSVFTYNAALNPTYVTATIQLPSTGELNSTQSRGIGHNFALSAGAYLRNAAAN